MGEREHMNAVSNNTQHRWTTGHVSPAALCLALCLECLGSASTWRRYGGKEGSHLLEMRRIIFYKAHSHTRSHVEQRKSLCSKIPFTLSAQPQPRPNHNPLSCSSQDEGETCTSKPIINPWLLGSSRGVISDDKHPLPPSPTQKERER